MRNIFWILVRIVKVKGLLLFMSVKAPHFPANGFSAILKNFLSKKKVVEAIYLNKKKFNMLNLQKQYFQC